MSLMSYQSSIAMQLWATTVVLTGVQIKDRTCTYIELSNGRHYLCIFHFSRPESFYMAGLRVYASNSRKNFDKFGNTAESLQAACHPVIVMKAVF